MARYTVHMTFEAPGLPAAYEQKHSLPGMGASMRLIGSEGHLAVTASGVRAQEPAVAALAVTTEVERLWNKVNGPLKLASWRADPERVLVGGRRRRAAGGFGTGPWPDGFPAAVGFRRPGRPGWLFGDDGGSDDDKGDGSDGSAGVREPRRPKPGPGSASMEAELPGPEHYSA
jgi:hypothetical protein